MLVGTQNHANLANSQKGAGGTDFSIAAIMARGPSSREPSERSSSKFFHNETANRQKHFANRFYFVRRLKSLFNQLMIRLTNGFKHCINSQSIKWYSIPGVTPLNTFWNRKYPFAIIKYFPNTENCHCRRTVCGLSWTFVLGPLLIDTVAPTLLKNPQFKGLGIENIQFKKDSIFRKERD